MHTHTLKPADRPVQIQSLAPADPTTIALKGNALVFSAEGGLKLSYKKKAQ